MDIKEKFGDIDVCIGYEHNDIYPEECDINGIGVNPENGKVIIYDSYYSYYVKKRWKEKEFEFVVNWIENQLMENSLFVGEECEYDENFINSPLAKKIEREDAILRQIRNLLIEFKTVRETPSDNFS